MQNNTAYYKAQNDPFGGFVPLPFQCSCSYVFHCLSVTVAFYTLSYQTVMCLHMCVSVCVCVFKCECACTRIGLWEYECLHFLSVPYVSICINVMPRSKCLHPTSEAQRCEEIITKDKKDTYMREILRHHRPQWCECSWLEDTDKLSIMCARPLPPLSHCQAVIEQL